MKMKTKARAAEHRKARPNSNRKFQTSLKDVLKGEPNFSRLFFLLQIHVAVLPHKFIERKRFGHTSF